VTRSDDASNEDLDERVRAAKAAVLTQVDREKLEGIHTRLRTLEASQGMSTGRLESLEGWRKVTMAIVGAVAVAALGSLWTAYTAARDAGNRDGRVDTQIEALEGAVGKLETQIESLWRIRVRSLTGDQP
jgi:chaperonin cofactor prefoldin